MAVSRQELQRRLAKLEADMPELIAKYQDPGDFISEFSGHADSIAGCAGADDDAWAWAEIDRILTKFGHPPMKDELPPDE